MGLRCAPRTEDHHRLRRIGEHVQVRGVVLVYDVRLLLLRLEGDLRLLALIRFLSARALGSLVRIVLRLCVLALLCWFLLSKGRERLAGDLQRRVHQRGKLGLDHVPDRLLQHRKSAVAARARPLKVHLHELVCQRVDIVLLAHAHFDWLVLQCDKECQKNG